MIPIILNGSGTPTGPTLRELRNRLADELGFYHATTVTTEASSSEASRVVIADEVRDDETGFDFLGQWVYARDGAQAGVQRRIISQPGVGYQGARSVLLLSRPFAASLDAGTAIEITAPLPSKRHAAIKGLNDLINEGLARIWVEVRIALTGNGTYEYDLSAYPWLTRASQTRGIYDDRWTATGIPELLSPYTYDIATNGINRTLQTQVAYTTADTFHLAAIVRADRLVFDGSSWSYVTTPGLLNDTYQAAVPEEWAVAFAMVKSLQYLTRLTMQSRQLDKDEKAATLADIMDRRRIWAAAAASIKRNEMPKPLHGKAEELTWTYYPPRWTA